MNNFFLKIILSPFPLLYGLIVMLRNIMFDLHILPQKSFKIPIIGVGNLNVGGSGKTPHVEYLLRLLNSKNNIATLSRGYGRKTSGFFLATDNSKVEEIGDEPLQMKKKYKDIIVSVDEKRSRGVKNLMQKFPALKVILLDDAFQHRYVKSGVNILLTDYYHLYSNDMMLPSGRLREFKSGAKRADIIIVTKAPAIFSPIERRRIIEELKPKPSQAVYFSYVKYGNFVSLIDNKEIKLESKPYNILLISGIANTIAFEEYLKRQCEELLLNKFPDHYQFTTKDVENLRKTFVDLFPKNKIIVTTEKDAMRLKQPAFLEILKDLPIYYIPIEIEFHNEDKKEFDNQILTFVKTFEK